MDSLFFSARLLLDAGDSEVFQVVSVKDSFICFLFGFIIKVFVFSIIYAAVKQVYDVENREFSDYRKKHLNKRLGDFLFFMIGFVLKNFYNFKEYRKLLKEHHEIVNGVKKTMPERKNFTEFSELTEYETVDLAENLEKNKAKLNLDQYEIIKFYLRQKRNVYLIIKKK
jgi:hypothetical protein